MRHDDAALSLCRVFRQHAGDVFVGKAVESVAPDTFCGERARNGEQLGQRWLCAMEGCVEAGDLRHAGKALGEGLDAVEVVRLMQRGEHDELFKRLDGSLID